MTFNYMLASFVERGASDIHLHAGLYPMARLSGRLVPVGETKLTPTATESLVAVMCDERQAHIFAEKYQVDLAYSILGVARFRVNLFRQRGSVSAVLRVIVINLDEAQLRVVNLPPELLSFSAIRKRGLS